MATQIDDKYKSPYGDHEWQEGYGIWESGFKKGTQCIIEKAVEWFRNQKEEIGISWFDDYETRLRKAMEE